MTITPQVKRQFFALNGESNQVIRLPPATVSSPVGPNRRAGKPWTHDEHDRFLEGLQIFPNGPWRHIATHVGTRTSRQTMTHAQKYRERISRQIALQPRPTAFTQPTALGVECAANSRLQLDELDLQILACLLDTDEGVSGNSLSDPNRAEATSTLLEDVKDTEMLTQLSELEVGDHFHF